jgi:hypothetical protein
MKLVHGLIVAGLILTGPVWGKHWHEDQDDWNWHQQHAQDQGKEHHQPSKGCYFEPHDVLLISEYYPPRYRLLPSSQEKKIHRNGPLPSGWETRFHVLPTAVENVLIPVPVGYRRGILGGFAVVYNLQSGIITDATPLFGPL